MTAIALAMLGSVLLASAVLAFVGLMHELTRSRRGRRWMRRRRDAIDARTDALTGLVVRGLRLSRRSLAGQLSRPAPVQLPRPAAGVRASVPAMMQTR
ncbi:hypothetical protein [Phytoactinopolyspora mesophila]|uniref:Uncharacterized protein n=1 Tax=Phytoactinopolyspora mesophila TaxID=2650750 RepID=A0A7K3M7Z2_9ACTN|nr:hypothetical protein [Phytoactinopolyspora mesophila]NDL59384.1 hypothetical protein [Phytoactinopolyspora mesophila]